MKRIEKRVKEAVHFFGQKGHTYAVVASEVYELAYRQACEDAEALIRNHGASSVLRERLRALPDQEVPDE